MKHNLNYDRNGYLTNDPDDDFYGSNTKGCIWTVVGWVIAVILFFMLGVLSSCTTTRESTGTLDHHYVESLMQRMDSVIASRTVIQQDSSWRELVLRQFQAIREKSDTSHYVVTDTSGKIIRERIVINNIRELTSESERHEREVIMHQLSVMDSTISVMQKQIQHSDSILCQEKKTEIQEVEKPLTWWQQLRLWLGNILLATLLLAAGYAAFLLWRRFHPL